MKLICYGCGLPMDKPYAIWHWQSGKPARSYCWLCWEQKIGLPKQADKDKTMFTPYINRFGHKFRIGWTNLHYLKIKESHLLSEPHFKLFPKEAEYVWDVGCSFGLWSYYASSRPNKASVLAFDLSPKSAYLCKINNSNKVKVIPRPLTLNQVFYSEPLTACQENKICPGNSISCDWRQAISFNPDRIPDVIKMDIEGGELDFLRDSVFIAWIRSNGIKWFVECHSEKAEALCQHLGMKNHHECPNHFHT